MVTSVCAIAIFRADCWIAYEPFCVNADEITAITAVAMTDSLFEAYFHTMYML